MPIPTIDSAVRGRRTGYYIVAKSFRYYYVVLDRGTRCPEVFQIWALRVHL